MFIFLPSFKIHKGNSMLSKILKEELPHYPDDDYFLEMVEEGIIDSYEEIQSGSEYNDDSCGEDYEAVYCFTKGDESIHFKFEWYEVNEVKSKTKIVEYFE